jgi:hypothetical protein
MKFFKSLLSLVTFITLSVVALNAFSAPPSGGGPPSKYYWDEVVGDPGEWDDPLISCDGFEVWIHVEYSGWWIYHPATPGKGGWEFYHTAVATRVYNASNPDLFVEGKRGGHWNRHWAGEPFESSNVETGLQMLITLPGYGVVYRDVGRVVWDENFDPVIYVGHWDLLDGNYDEDFQALCDVLSG